LWIIQEVLLASDVEIYCGRIKFRRSDFLSMLETYFKAEPRLGPSNMPRCRSELKDCPASTVVGHRKVMVLADIDSPALPLCPLIHQFGHAKCEDVRDRIFGLHSLALSCCQKAIPVDYSCSVYSLTYKLLEHQCNHHSDTPGYSVFHNLDELHQSLLEGAKQQVGSSSFKTGDWNDKYSLATLVAAELPTKKQISVIISRFDLPFGAADFSTSGLEPSPQNGFDWRLLCSSLSWDLTLSGLHRS
jgi:hypothetical protein